MKHICIRNNVDLGFEDYSKFWVIFPFSTTATVKNLSNEIPLTKTGLAKIKLTFSLPRPNEDLQQMYTVYINKFDLIT